MRRAGPAEEDVTAFVPSITAERGLEPERAARHVRRPPRPGFRCPRSGHSRVGGVLCVPGIAAGDTGACPRPRSFQRQQLRVTLQWAATSSAPASSLLGPALMKAGSRMIVISTYDPVRPMESGQGKLNGRPCKLRRVLVGLALRGVALTRRGGALLGTSAIAGSTFKTRSRAWLFPAALWYPTRAPAAPVSSAKSESLAARGSPATPRRSVTFEMYRWPATRRRLRESFGLHRDLAWGRRACLAPSRPGGLALASHGDVVAAPTHPRATDNDISGVGVVGRAAEAGLPSHRCGTGGRGAGPPHSAGAYRGRGPLQRWLHRAGRRRREAESRGRRCALP